MSGTSSHHPPSSSLNNISNAAVSLSSSPHATASPHNQKQNSSSSSSRPKYHRDSSFSESISEVIRDLAILEGSNQPRDDGDGGDTNNNWDRDHRLHAGTSNNNSKRRPKSAGSRRGSLQSHFDSFSQSGGSLFQNFGTSRITTSPSVPSAGSPLATRYSVQYAVGAPMLNRTQSPITPGGGAKRKSSKKRASSTGKIRPHSHASAEAGTALEFNLFKNQNPTTLKTTNKRTQKLLQQLDESLSEQQQLTMKAHEDSFVLQHNLRIEQAKAIEILKEQLLSQGMQLEIHIRQEKKQREEAERLRVENERLAESVQQMTQQMEALRGQIGQKHRQIEIEHGRTKNLRAIVQEWFAEKRKLHALREARKEWETGYLKRQQLGKEMISDATFSMMVQDSARLHQQLLESERSVQRLENVMYDRSRSLPTKGSGANGNTHSGTAKAKPSSGTHSSSKSNNGNSQNDQKFKVILSKKRQSPVLTKQQEHNRKKSNDEEMIAEHHATDKITTTSPGQTTDQRHNTPHNHIHNNSNRTNFDMSTPPSTILGNSSRSLSDTLSVELSKAEEEMLHLVRSNPKLLNDDRIQAIMNTSNQKRTGR